MNPLLLLGILAGGMWLFGRDRNNTYDVDPEGAVLFDVYPSTASVEATPAPMSVYGVNHTQDCSKIAVAHGWWEGIAKPAAAKMKGTPADIALELVLMAVPQCADRDPTPAVNEFLADVEKAVAKWKGSPLALLPGASSA